MTKKPTWASVRIRTVLDDEINKFLLKNPHLENKSRFVSNTLIKAMKL
jgi:hypothetical protein